MRKRSICNSKEEAVKRLWRMLDDWAESYARVNRKNPEVLVAEIAERHQQLARLHRERLAENKLGVVA